MAPERGPYLDAGMSVRGRGVQAVPVLGAGFRVGMEDNAPGYVNPDDGLRRHLSIVAETMLTAPELIVPTVEMYCKYAADTSLDDKWGPVNERSVHLDQGRYNIASVSSTGGDNFRFNGDAPHELRTNEFDPERAATDDPYEEDRDPSVSRHVTVAKLASRVHMKYGESMKLSFNELKVTLSAMKRPQVDLALRGGDM